MRPRDVDDQFGEDNEIDGDARGRPGRKKRLAQDTSSKASKIRKTRHDPDDAAEVDEDANPPSDVAQVIVQVREVDRFCSIPSFPAASPPTPDVLLLASAVRGRLAVAQFRDIVKEWRGVNASSRLRHGGNRFQRFGRLIDGAEDSLGFAEFRLRIGQAGLAAELDATVSRGFKKVGGDKRKDKREELGWSEQRFEYQLAKGRKWNRICGNKFRGIIGFIFTTHRNAFGIPPEDFKKLGKQVTSKSIAPSQISDPGHQDLSKFCREFHGLLDDDYTQAICRAGKAFESAVVDSDPNIEFKWETLPDSPDWTTLPEPELLSYMQPYEPATTNVYRPTEYLDWPRPDAWPDKWAWPVNPLSEGVVGCEYCAERDCQCLTRYHKSMPSIRHYGCRGLGLQAVAQVSGRVVYKKNATIGWLLGKIIPPSVLNNPGRDRCVEFVRPDIPGEPVVCHLECLDSSNLFRLLNHDCSPVAQLTPRRISSQYVLAVVAKQDIIDGMEITISYTRKHYGLHCSCRTCEARKRTPLPNGKGRQ
ncbi:hypothetical protein PG997_009185 [Apiospora hydei]|uniref:SET domain-containing protein n=1 Tax=Apiospora hydei TaxID=1337664 RepID=A0ABR1VTI2_9PEZI